MAYSKLHASLVNSSLWCESDDVRLLFITMLALADRDGYVYGSRVGIVRQANITVTEKDPFDHLMAPDPGSSDLLRNPENEGRRIEEIEGGFRIINYPYYRGLRNDDDRKIQNREAQRRHRKKLSGSQPASATVSHGQPSPSASASDSESVWIEELKKDVAYEGIDVQREYAKALRWYKERKRTCTRRAFINWLNKSDRNLNGTNQKPYSAINRNSGTTNEGKSSQYAGIGKAV